MTGARAATAATTLAPSRAYSTETACLLVLTSLAMLAGLGLVRS